MTKQKHLKDRIRARMKKTGERYTVARRHVLAKASTAATVSGPAAHHVPGNVPATTALRVLLSGGGHPTAQNTPLSESLLFGIAGGIGMGVFAFRYEQDDYSSFFVAGRHLWQDDLAYLTSAFERLGVGVEVLETGGVKVAERQLREALADESPVVAWVDRAHLPRHAASHCEDGMYHVVTVYAIDEDAVLIGDLADEPDRVPLAQFAQARSRIKKQKNRLLRITGTPDSIGLTRAVNDGLRACHDSLIGRGAVKPPGGKAMAGNFTLDAIARWADRMHGSSGKHSWSSMFPRGLHFWRGLTSIYSFIQYGSGGGLARPLFSQFFTEAHALCGSPAMKELADRYGQLGEDWDALGAAALPEGAEPFSRFRQLSVERAELGDSEGTDGRDRLEAIAAEMAGLEKQAASDFPLDEPSSDALRQHLKVRITQLHADEVAAHELLSTAIEETEMA